MLNLWVSLHVESHGSSKPWCNLPCSDQHADPSKCLDGAEKKELREENSWIIFFEFNGGNCDYFATGLRNCVFFSIWDDSNPLWTNQVWNFRREVSVVWCFFCFKHVGMDLTSRNQNVLIYLCDVSFFSDIWCSHLCIHHWNWGVGFVSMRNTSIHRRTCQNRNPKLW